MGSDNSKNERNGLRILKISPNSPASKTDLNLFLDFVIDVSNKPANFTLERDFYKYAIANENKVTDIHVYNILSKTTRIVQIKLSRDWPDADFLLGFKVRFESITDAERNMYRILGVRNPNLLLKITP